MSSMQNNLSMEENLDKTLNEVQQKIDKLNFVSKKE
mgnify:CR=1 FL=1